MEESSSVRLYFDFSPHLLIQSTSNWLAALSGIRGSAVWSFTDERLLRKSTCRDSSPFILNRNLHLLLPRHWTRAPKGLRHNPLLTDETDDCTGFNKWTWLTFHRSRYQVTQHVVTDPNVEKLHYEPFCQVVMLRTIRPLFFQFNEAVVLYSWYNHKKRVEKVE